MKPEEQRNPTSTEPTSTPLDLEQIGAQSLGQLKQGLENNLLSPLKDNAQRCFTGIADFCHSRANKMIGYTVAVAQGHGAQATSQALGGFKDNVVDAFKAGSQALGEGLRTVGQIGTLAVDGVVAGSTAILDQSKQGLHNFKTVVEDLCTKGIRSYKEFQSGVRNNEVKKFSEKQLAKLAGIADGLQDEDRQNAAQVIKADTHTIISGAYKQAIDCAKNEHQGLLTDEVKAELKTTVREALKEARGKLWKQRGGEVLDDRVTEMREKLQAAGLPEEDQKRAEQAIIARQNRYERSLEMRGDIALNRSEPRIAAKFADSMEQDLDRRISVLQRIGKIEAAGQQISTIDGGRLDDQATKDIVTGLRQRFDAHTEDSKFSFGEFIEMQGEINVAALRVGSLELRQAIVNSLGVKESELKYPDNSANSGGEDQDV